MTKLDFMDLRINRRQITNTTDYFKELVNQFYLDCNPEDIKTCVEARRCWRQMKRLQRHLIKINKAEIILFSI